MTPTVSVIIPTTCETKRWGSLQRAIASVLDGQGVDVRVIVVVNGNRVDEDCYQALRGRPDLTVAYQEQGSAPLAQRLGRTLVATDFFAFLDDDDEYLPMGLWHRVQPLLSDPALGFVASNGVRRIGDAEQVMVRDAQAVNADPVAALAGENWMASCGGLFRTASVTASYFDDPAPFMEWTYLAYKLGLDLTMRFVDQPTFRINDTPGSLSKSDSYLAAELAVLERIGALPLPPRPLRLVQAKIGAAYHVMADHARLQGEFGRAWRYHLKSMSYPGALRFLAYSRKLLAFGVAPEAPAGSH